MGTFVNWISEWVETLRVAPPFSRRRRDIIEATRDIDDPTAWIEVNSPEGLTCMDCGGTNARGTVDGGWCDDCQRHVFIGLTIPERKP